ncbi:MAG: endonuclease domain-containing protein [Candidatus Limnocylindrales bacterium]
MVADAIRRQGGRCAVGGEPLGAAYIVEHCHRCAVEVCGHDPNRGCPRCFRGIACAKHNAGLGAFGDSPLALARAAVYAAHGVHGMEA